MKYVWLIHRLIIDWTIKLPSRIESFCIIFIQTKAWWIWEAHFHFGFREIYFQGAYIVSGDKLPPTLLIKTLKVHLIEAESLPKSELIRSETWCKSTFLLRILHSPGSCLWSTKEATFLWKKNICNVLHKHWCKTERLGTFKGHPFTAKETERDVTHSKYWCIHLDHVKC